MMNVQAAAETAQLFADPTRLRLAAVLARHELTVAELVRITDAAQSRVSAHLARLRAAGILKDRRAGTATFYVLPEQGLPAPARRIWDALREGVADSVLDEDRRRADAVVRSRQAARSWPDAVAGQMERHYSPGRTWESAARGFLGLLELGDVLDAGSGDGTVAEMIAPRCRSVTLLERNPRVLEAARRRLHGVGNARFREGDVSALPWSTPTFDQVLLFHVLTDVAEPARVLAECRRVLRPGGRLTLLALAEHAHLELAAPYGHLHAGFRPDRLRTMLRRAGLRVESCGVVCREKRHPGFQVLGAVASVPPARKEQSHARK